MFDYAGGLGKIKRLFTEPVLQTLAEGFTTRQPRKLGDDHQLKLWKNQSTAWKHICNNWKSGSG
jgi:hypothetical protein